MDAESKFLHTKKNFSGNCLRHRQPLIIMLIIQPGENTLMLDLPQRKFNLVENTNPETFELLNISHTICSYDAPLDEHLQQAPAGLRLAFCSLVGSGQRRYSVWSCVDFIYDDWGKKKKKISELPFVCDLITKYFNCMFYEMIPRETQTPADHITVLCFTISDLVLVSLVIAWKWISCRSGEIAGRITVYLCAQTDRGSRIGQSGGGDSHSLCWKHSLHFRSNIINEHTF